MLKNIVLITLLIIALGGVAVLAYQQLTPSKEAEPEQETGQGESGMIKTQEAPTTPELPEVDTSDWKVYRNEEYGFELRYPPKFTDGYVRSYESPGVAGISFRLPDELSRPFPAEPSGEGLPDTLPDYDFYARRFIYYRDVPVPDPCRAADVAPREEVIIDGVRFVRTGVMNPIEYIGRYEDICYRFRFNRYLSLRSDETANEIRKSLPEEILDFEQIVSTWRLIQ